MIFFKSDVNEQGPGAHVVSFGKKEGKKRMKSIGSVEIPQEAFIGVLKINKN